jgi:hypothetical protein
MHGSLVGEQKLSVSCHWFAVWSWSNQSTSFSFFIYITGVLIASCRLNTKCAKFLAGPQDTTEHPINECIINYHRTKLYKKKKFFFKVYKFTSRNNPQKSIFPHFLPIKHKDLLNHYLHLPTPTPHTKPNISWELVAHTYNPKIRRILVQNMPRQKVHKTPSQIKVTHARLSSQVHGKLTSGELQIQASQGNKNQGIPS